MNERIFDESGLFLLGLQRFNDGNDNNGKNGKQAT